MIKISYVKYKIGTIVKNNQGIEFKIKNITGEGHQTRYDLISRKTGFQINISRSALYSKKYLDKLDISLYDVGIMGHAKNYTQKEYNLWSGMISRCYNSTSTSYEYYGEKGISVSKRWHRFDFFIKDIKNLNGYDKYKFENNEIELDKDLLQKNVETCNKIYSKDTCCFVSREINTTNTVRNRKFYALTPDGKIESHTVVKYYALENNLDDSCIHKNLKGTRNGWHKGYYFSYNKEDIKNVIEKKTSNDYRKTIA